MKKIIHLYISLFAVFIIFITAGFNCLPCMAAIDSSSPGIKPRPLAEYLDQGKWHQDFDEAIRIAAEKDQSVLALFTLPGCRWCDVLKYKVLTETEIRKLLVHFTRVEINTMVHPELASRFRVHGTPTIVFLTPGLREKGRIQGVTGADTLKQTLLSMVSAKIRMKGISDIRDLLAKAEKEGLTLREWSDLMLEMGKAEIRGQMTDRILGLNPFPREKFVSMLEDKRLVVRLGALEILEEISGDHFDFDPWEPWQADPRAKAALEKWKAWAEKSDPESPENFYTALSSRQLTRYLNDMISADRVRYTRAMRKLEQAGESVLDELDNFTKAHPELPPGLLKRVREVRYAVIINTFMKKFPPGIAHQLVFGNLDSRMQAMRSLDQAGVEAMYILRDFLEDKEVLIRETAVDTLIKVGKREVIPVIEQHVVREKDTDVLITILKGLGKLRSRRSLKLLISYLKNPEEDLAITSLQSITDLKTKMAESEVGEALDDPRWRVRVAALKCARSLKLKNLADKTEKLLTDPDPFVQFNAVRTFARLKGAEAAKTLENIFMENDRLKGPVIRAFDIIDVEIPRIFTRALEGKDDETLFTILDSLKECGKDGLVVASWLSGHENEDLACGAVRIIARYGMEKAEYRKILTQKFLNGRPALVLAALQSARIPDTEIRKMRMFDFQGSSPGSSPDKKEIRFLDDIFQAFLGDQGAPARPGPGQAVSLDSLFSAFLGPDETSSDSEDENAGLTGSMEELIKAVKPYLDKDDDGRIQRYAAVFLLRIHDPRAIELLLDTMDTLLVDQRIDIAECIMGSPSDKMLPLVEKLIKDSSAQVRKKAASGLLANAKKEAWLSLLFDELTRKDSAIKVHEVKWNLLKDWKSESGLRRKLRTRVMSILKEEKRPRFINLALRLLSLCWKDSDEKMTEPFLKSENPWTRRAAWRTLGLINQEKFTADILRITHDPAEPVRQVVPSVFRRDSYSFQNHFDDEFFETENIYRYSYERKSLPRLKPEAANALKELAGDPSLKIRFESKMALLTNFESTDLHVLIQDINSFNDPSEPIGNITEFIKDNFKRLGPEYAVLLPLVKKEDISDKTRELIDKHFNLTPSGKKQKRSYVLREDPLVRPAKETSPLERTGEESSEKQSLEKQSLEKQGMVRLFFFHDPGCTECENADELLHEMQKTFPYLRTDKYDLNTNAGIDLNESLCHRFNVSERHRMFTPSVFAGSGYLAGEDINYESLADLIRRSVHVPQLKTDVLVAKENEQEQETVEKNGQNYGWKYFFMGLCLAVVAGFVFMKKRWYGSKD